MAKQAPKDRKDAAAAFDVSKKRARLESRGGRSSGSRRFCEEEDVAAAVVSVPRSVMKGHTYLCLLICRKRSVGDDVCTHTQRKR